MNQHIDLTTGPIGKKLVALALPIMGVSFIQTAYNLIDMLWIGKVGSQAVAAVGTAGFFTWFAEAFILIARLGAGIKIAQSIGQKDYLKTKDYIHSSLQLGVVLSLLYGLVLLLFNNALIGFFNLGDASVIEMARIYLIIVACGMLFFFSGPIFTGIFNAIGDSKTPFVINTIGLLFNIILDPILIFGWMGVPKLGVMGAAIATVTAQVIVSLCFIVVILKRKLSYFTLNIFVRPKWTDIKEIVIIGLPGAVQSGLFTLFSMVIGRIVAYWGPVAIAVQKVGSQIEAISWMTAGGFSTALSTYVGQNYGASQYERIKKGVRTTLYIASVVGIFATLVLIFGRTYLFKLFLDEAEALSMGTRYLLILGYSQLFMCLEITITGAFNGLGRTYLPNAVTIILTGLRIPLALVLARADYLGLDGVWWSISLTSILKGIVLIGVYEYLKHTNRLYRVGKNTL